MFVILAAMDRIVFGLCYFTQPCDYRVRNLAMTDCNDVLVATWYTVSCHIFFRMQYWAPRASKWRGSGVLLPAMYELFINPIPGTREEEHEDQKEQKVKHALEGADTYIPTPERTASKVVAVCRECRDMSSWTNKDNNKRRPHKERGPKRRAGQNKKNKTDRKYHENT